VRIHPLTDETNRQEQQCLQAGMRLDDDIDDLDSDLPFGADPFDVIAELEAQQGHPLALS
jgi:hypothetical protein